MSHKRLGPQASGWAAQENRKEMLLWPEEWGSICCSSVQSPTPLSHSKTFRNPFEPFQIKWEVYFSKELCSLVSIVLNMFLHTSAYEYVTAWVSIRVRPPPPLNTHNKKRSYVKSCLVGGMDKYLPQRPAFRGACCHQAESPGPTGGGCSSWSIPEFIAWHHNMENRKGSKKI